MTVTLSDAERRVLALFEDETGAEARDCVADGEERFVVLVAPGEMGRAIGPDGEHVGRVERTLGRSIEVVEDAHTPEAFVANALAPAAVRHVTISEQDDTVAYAEVPEGDRGVAIGRDGRNIELARRLAARHYGIDDVQLT